MLQSFYKQNMLTFSLDPHLLKVRTRTRSLYQQVTIEPVVYDPLDVEGGRIVHRGGLTGSFL
jgi:two-component system phosphate regulon sensor histidine kinase PhoR